MPSHSSGARFDSGDLDGLLDDLDGLLDLDRDNLGSEILDTTAEGIRDRTLDRQQTVDGDELPKNKGSYGKGKRARGVPVGQGLGSEKPRMLDADELKGEVAITAAEASMSPGTSELGRNKARWFQNGKGERQEGRDFYGVDDETEARVIDLIEDAVDDRLSSL